MTKITKKEFEKLYSDTIIKKEYDAIIRKIDDRFSEIMLTLKPSFKTKGWFDYGNCLYDSEKSGGFFDPYVYKEEIDIGGESSDLLEPYGSYIPTRWLWEDFEDEYKRETQAFVSEEQAKKLRAKSTAKKRKEEKAKLHASIRKKLTKEELQVIKFK